MDLSGGDGFKVCDNGAVVKAGDWFLEKLPSSLGCCSENSA